MRKFMIAAAVVALGGCRETPANDAAPSNQLTANDAAASDVAIPDMKGKWAGTSESIVTGMAKHHEAPSGDEPLLDNVEFTYVVEGQDGHRFWGTLTSPNFEEQLAGVVAKDGKSIVARTSEGEIRGTLVDPDTIDLTYSAGGRSTVLAVNTWKRARQ